MWPVQQARSHSYYLFSTLPKLNFVLALTIGYQCQTERVLPDVVVQQEQLVCPAGEGRSTLYSDTTPRTPRVLWAPSRGHCNCGATSPSRRTRTKIQALTQPCCYWKSAPASGRHFVVMPADQSHLTWNR